MKKKNLKKKEKQYIVLYNSEFVVSIFGTEHEVKYDQYMILQK